MRNQIISAALSISMAATTCGVFVPVAYANGEVKAPQYQTAARKMEQIGRGLVAVYRTSDGRNVKSTEAGVYLSWRLLGDEPLETQEYDIYKNDIFLASTTGARGTNYIDTAGKSTDTYKVVKKGASLTVVESEIPVATIANHTAASNQYSNLVNSFAYMDIEVERPANVGSSAYYNDGSAEGGQNDASVGDLDGDGDYEIVLKWDPTDSKDSASSGSTGPVYLDGYEIDPQNTDASKNSNGHLYKWRINLGPHIRAGAHDTQFMVYDFDGDGRSEIMTMTAPGSIDSLGRYVSEVGDTEEIRNVDNTLVQLRKGKNIGPEYYTVFDGETGAALATTAAIPLGSETGGDWGDSKMNRAYRYLAAVAYLDGVHPSIIMCRGYYDRAVLRAYSWDGSELSMDWEYDAKSGGKDSLYGQGNHNISVADVDNDGKDEIVYGSACLDDDGRTVLGNTQLGHGDAIHVSDFNNDGIQESFSVKEKSGGYTKFAEDLWVPATGAHFWEQGKVVTSGDNGRGVMDNIDDAYAKANPNALAIGWSSGFANAHDLNGDDLKAKPAGAGKGSFDNFLVYWDGDLGRELLDANIIQKYNAATGVSTRFWGENDGYTLTGAYTNNYTKRNPCLVADIFGDWREEIIMTAGRGQTETPTLRIFTSTIPTDYRLTTLMHDSQYRMSVVWQNVGYNQPTHTSYYIGSAALATDGTNTLNYLAPATAYTKVTYTLSNVPVTGVSLSQQHVSVEKGKTAAISARIEPVDASKKGVIWQSSNPEVATVTGGIVTGVSSGTATITATTKDGGFTASCEVSVYTNPIWGMTLSEYNVELWPDGSKTLKAIIKPSYATVSKVEWTSSDPSVASVNDDGVVTGHSYGSAVISAETEGHTAYCSVLVKPIGIVDATGSDAFVSTTNTSDFTGTANSAAFKLNESANAVNEFHKDFEVFTDNKAILNYKLVTGGVKINGSDWNWTDHEYSFKFNFVDSEGNDILALSQAYTSSAQTLMSKVGSADAKAFSSDWTPIIEGMGNIQGSAKRWIVNIEFDYGTDTATAVISGCDSSWTVVAQYKKTFSLDGAKFKTLQYSIIKDKTGGVTATPTLSDLSYASTTTMSGITNKVYQKGVSTETAWQESDISDWNANGGVAVSYSADAAEFGRIFYNETKPATAYSANKTFDMTDGSMVTYNLDWYFGSATSRDTNFECVRIGSNFVIGWTSGYVTWVSTDGGVTWNDNNGDGTPDSIFNGSNSTFTKNVNVVIDTKTNTIKSFAFGGTTIDAYTGYKLPDTATIDSVGFGFIRGGATDGWEYPCGLNSISVSEFFEGEDPVIDDSEIIKPINGYENTVNIRKKIADGAVTVKITPKDDNVSGMESVKLYTAEYDEYGNLIGIKTADSIMDDNGLTVSTDAPATDNYKLLLWNADQKPLTYTMIR